MKTITIIKHENSNKQTLIVEEEGSSRTIFLDEDKMSSKQISNRLYYERNKAKILANQKKKVTCKHCGRIVAYSGMSYHRRKACPVINPKTKVKPRKAVMKKLI